MTSSRNQRRVADVFRKSYGITKALDKFNIGSTSTAWNETAQHFRAKGMSEKSVQQALRRARLALAVREGWKKSLVDRYRTEVRSRRLRVKRATRHGRSR
jgi:hypothetical protein